MDTAITTLPFIRTKDILLTTALSAGYLLLSCILIGFRPEQVFLVAVFNSLYYASRYTRKLIIGFSVFIVYWIIFDYMKAFPNYRYRPVHIGSLYGLEKSLFGIAAEGRRLTPNEFFLVHQSRWMDVLAGLFYLCWVPVPLAFAGWLFHRDRRMFLEFSLSFLLVNLIGFVIYYAYPAAPPWYIQEYGTVFHPQTPGNVAGLARFDEALHTRLFHGMYTKSSNVFAAMPSLHSAYPVITLYYAIASRKPAAIFSCALVMAGIWVSAVYTSHHYVLDVLAGIACALTALLVFRRIRTGRWLGRYLAIINR